MILLVRKILFIVFISKFKSKKNLSFINLNFRNNDFTNYHQIRSFIFKKDFFKIKNKNIHNFDFLNFSKKLGGKMGINLSKDAIFCWYKINKNRLGFPWSDDLTSKRLINLLYNYEYINSSSKLIDKKKLDLIIFKHIQRVIFEFNLKKINEITSYDLVAYSLSSLIFKKFNIRDMNYIKFIIDNQVDKLGMHKTYNVLEHSKFINNINELKNILLFFNIEKAEIFDDFLLKMTSVLNQYFHNDGSLPLFNGSNNIFTKIINDSINKDFYYKKRNFDNVENGIAFYSDKYKKFFLM